MLPAKHCAIPFPGVQRQKQLIPCAHWQHKMVSALSSWATMEKNSGAGLIPIGIAGGQMAALVGLRPSLRRLNRAANGYTQYRWENTHARIQLWDVSTFPPHPISS